MRYLDWTLDGAGVPTATISHGRARGANVWKGLPRPVSMMCTSCGGGAQLADGSYVFLAVTQFGPDWAAADRTHVAPCCNNSVVAFASKDGLEWTYSATVGLYDTQRVYQEGPNECDVVLLKDKKTLWAAMRTDGGDGTPSHRTLPFLSSTSTDGGRHWTRPKPLPDNMLSSQPKAAVLGNGALLLTAGRPGLDLWVSVDGFGANWRRYSLPAKHNALSAAEGHPRDWRYCDAFVAVAENHTFAGDPTPRRDMQRDGGPLRGCKCSSCLCGVIKSLIGTAAYRCTKQRLQFHRGAG